jgi:hypothetical protein
MNIIQNENDLRVYDITCCNKNSPEEFSAIILKLRFHRQYETVVVLPDQWVVYNGEYMSLANLNLSRWVEDFVYNLGEYVFSPGCDDVPHLNFIESFSRGTNVPLDEVFHRNSPILKIMWIEL